MGNALFLKQPIFKFKLKFSLRYWTKCHILIFFSQLCPAFKSWPPVSSFCGCWHLYCCRSRRGSNLTMVSSTSTTSYRTPWTFSCQCYYELKCDTQFWTSCLLSTTVSYFFSSAFTIVSVAICIHFYVNDRNKQSGKILFYV